MEKESLIHTIDPTGLQTLEVISQAEAFNKWMYQRIQPYLKGNILEIGSGIGNISDFVIKDGFDITLTDYNQDYCNKLKEKFEGFEKVRDIFILDLQHPNFTSAFSSLQGKFDTIFLLNVIEHLENDRKAVAYCSFMLKPGGRLIILAPAYQSLYSKLDTELGHYRRYRITDLKNLLSQQNFFIVQQQYFNFLGLFGWLVYGKVAGKKQLTSAETGIFNKLVPVARLLDKLVAQKLGLSVIITGEKK